MKILYGSTIEFRDKLIEEIPCKKPYFHPDYVNIMYSAEKGGTPEFFLIKNGSGFVYYQYVRRDIAEEIQGIPECEYYDIITPFDYGGYYCNYDLMDDFFRAFHSYCMDTGIISEFLRFVPTATFDYDKISEYINVRLLAEHVYIDLTKKDYHREFDSGKTDNLRKADKNKLKCVRTHDAKEFIRLYKQAMKKKGVNKYYLFSDKLIADLTKEDMAEAWYAFSGDTCVAGCVVLKGLKDIYYFLAANDPVYISMGASTFLINRIAGHYLNDKCILFLGGGQTGVYDFKKGFSDSRRPYYIGFNIYNKDKYDYLTKVADRQLNDYFPRYREKVI